MNEEQRKRLTDCLAENLPILRRKLRLSQKELADILGASRSTVSNIESGRNAMTWTTFLALVMVFRSDAETDTLLQALGIYSGCLQKFLCGKEVA